MLRHSDVAGSIDARNPYRSIIGKPGQPRRLLARPGARHDKAQREARVEGRAYEPVTDRARERSRFMELRDIALHQAQRATEWVVEALRRAQPLFSREALAAVGTRELGRQAQERAQAQAWLQLQQDQARREAVQREQLRQQQVERDRQRQIERDRGLSLGQ